MRRNQRTKKRRGRHPMRTLDERVTALVARLCGMHPAEISADATWRMLGLDSLDIVTLLVDCEQEFGIEISDADAITFYRAADLAAHLSLHSAAEMSDPA